MAQYDELVSVLRELLTNRFSPLPRYVNALLGDGQGNVVPPDRPDMSYARFTKESTSYFEVFNVTVPKVHNWPVKIGEVPWNPGLTQVVGTNWSAFEQSGWGDVLGDTSPHGPTHEYPDGSPGADVVNIHTRAIVPGRAFLTNAAPATVYVNALEYGTTGTLWGGLPGVNLQPLMSSMATGTMRYAGVYLDSTTNSLGIVTGATTVFTSAFDPPRVSFPATGAIPIARVRVYGGQSSLAEVDVKDARRLFSQGSAAGGGAPSGPAGGDLGGTYPNPQVQGLYGNSLASTAPGEGQVLMYSGSSWRPVALVLPDGWPYPKVHTVASSGADFTSVAAAIADTGVAAGDIIEVGENVTETNMAVNKAVTIRGVGQGVTITVTTGSSLGAGNIAGAYVTAAATLENITIVSSNNGETTNHAIYCDANATLRNVIASATGSTNRRGITVNTGRTVEIYECQASATGGGGENTGLLVSGTANVYGGRFSGDDYDIYVSSSSTANLYGPKLSGALENLGTIGTGSWWYDGNGDIHAAGLIRGLVRRVVSPSTLNVTDHLQSGNIPTGFAWAATSGVMYGTPTTLSYNLNGDYLGVTATAATRRHFLYKDIPNVAANWQGKVFDTSVRAGGPCEMGVRIDNNSSAADQPYLEFFSDATANNGTHTLKIRRRDIALGGETTTTTSAVKPVDTPFVIRLLTSYSAPNYSIICYILAQDGQVTSLVSSGTVTWFPTTGRVGLFVKEAGFYSMTDWFFTTF